MSSASASSDASKRKNMAIHTPSSKPTKLLIFLHGLGDNGHGWLDILAQSLPSSSSTKIICPHAPTMPVTLNGGFEMPAWYDLYDLRDVTRQDEPGLNKSVKFLNELIDSEVAELGLPNGTKDVVIGGFSQGATVALYAMLTCNKPYGGLAVLSSWLPMHTKLLQDKDHLSRVNAQLPILVCHGKNDEMVPLVLAQISVQMLKDKLGFSGVKFNTYSNMGHCSWPAEMEDFKNWLKPLLT